MAEFKVTLKCMWNSETGDFQLFADEEAMQATVDDDDEES